MFVSKLMCERVFENSSFRPVDKKQLIVNIFPGDWFQFIVWSFPQNFHFAFLLFSTLWDLIGTGKRRNVKDKCRSAFWIDVKEFRYWCCCFWWYLPINMRYFSFKNMKEDKCGTGHEKIYITLRKFAKAVGQCRVLSILM